MKRFFSLVNTIINEKTGNYNQSNKHTEHEVELVEVVEHVLCAKLRSVPDSHIYLGMLKHILHLNMLLGASRHI